MKKQDKAFMPIPCRLQTSIRPGTEISQVDTHPAFAYNQLPVDVVEKLSSLPVDVVHLAWAVLLRSYTFSDTVSFALFFSSQDQISHETPDEPRSDAQKVSVCQYHVVSDRKWGDWIPDAHQDLSPNNIEDIQTNTAIRQWTSRELEHHPSLYPHSEGFLPCVSVYFSLKISNFGPTMLSSGMSSLRLYFLKI